MTDMSDLARAAIIVTVVAVTASLGVIVLDDMKTSGSYSADTNSAFDGGIDAMTETTSWLDIIALVVASALILGFVLRIMQVI